MPRPAEVIKVPRAPRTVIVHTIGWLLFAAVVVAAATAIAVAAINKGSAIRINLGSDGPTTVSMPMPKAVELRGITMSESPGKVSLTAACEYQYGDASRAWLVPSTGSTPANWIQCVRYGEVLGGLNYNSLCDTGQADNNFLRKQWDGTPYWENWFCA
jgi:hypothetical protein